jgi:transcriptional regulator with XRE-family HTH domain
MATFGQVVAEWLERAMRQTGQTNKVQLARDADVARKSLCDALEGEGWPSRETVAKLADALGVEPPAFLLARPDIPETPKSWIGEARAALDRAERLLPP